MYAMTGTLSVQPGKRAVLSEILIRASALVKSMPGCHAYIVLEDLKDENTVAVFEMWNDKEAHDISLKDERVRSLITEAMPLMNGAPEGSEFRILGGYGISE
jgi:quinol monooxygenase YgiN